MKKSKFLILGLIAMMLLGGLVLVSCAPECDYTCGKKTDACRAMCKGKGGVLDFLPCEDACAMPNQR